MYSLLDENTNIYIVEGYTDFRKGMDSLSKAAMKNGLNPYVYMVYLFDSLPYQKNSKFDYSPYLPWAEGIGKRIEEHMRKRLPNS